MKTLWKIILAVVGIPVSLLMAVISRLTTKPLALAPGQSEALLIYSQVIWDEVWQRPQQYAWRVSQSHPTIYCCPVQPHNLLFLGTKWRPIRRHFDNGRHLIVLSPLILSGHFKSRLINSINCWLISTQLKHILSPVPSVNILTNTPFSYPVIHRLFIRTPSRPTLQRLVYDVIDDFTIFDWSPPFSKSYDALLMQRSNTILTGTHELTADRPGSLFIPCGVDYHHFATPTPPPADIHNLPKPLIGYFGTISERIDLSLIKRLAQEFPHASIVMIGPVHLSDPDLPKAPNIHYLGLRRHAQLPAYAQSFDVALIPFRLTPATLKLNPVKTLEYLAAGVPVVATALPDLVRFFSHTVHIATSPDDYVAAIRQSLTIPDTARIARGKQFANTMSWDAMTDNINSHLFLDDETPHAVSDRKP